MEPLFAAGAAALIALTLGVVLQPLRRGFAGADAAGRRRTAVLAIALGGGLPAGAFVLYGALGDADAAAPARAALSERLRSHGLPSGAQEAAGLRAALERHLQRQPADARALVLRARLDMQARRYDDAVAAYARAVAGASKAATDAGVWVEYAQAVALVQGGTLAGEPARLLRKALSLDATHAGALELQGSAAWEAGDFAQAAGHWQRLLAQTPFASARHAALSMAVERAAQRARFALPQAPRR